MMYISFLCLSMIQLIGCNSTAARLNLGNSGQRTIKSGMHTTPRNSVIVSNPYHSNQTDENGKNVNEAPLSNSESLEKLGFRPVSPTCREVRNQIAKGSSLQPRNQATSLSEDEYIAVEALLQLSQGLY